MIDDFWFVFIEQFSLKNDTFEIKHTQPINTNDKWTLYEYKKKCPTFGHMRVHHDVSENILKGAKSG